MARASDLPIYRDTYQLLLLVTKLTQGYPRGYRQGLARDVCLEAQAEHKTSIFPADKGVDFVGNVIRPFRRSARAKTQRNAIAKLAAVPQDSLSQSVNSYLGLSRHAGSRAQTIELGRAAMRRGLSVDYHLTRSFKHAD